VSHKMTSNPSTATVSDVDGSAAWIRLAISVVLATVGSIGLWAVVVILPAVQAEFAVDRGDASIPYAVTMVGFAVGNIVVGRYVDRLGIMIPVIGAALMLGAGFILAAMTTSIWQFSVIQGALLGVGTSTTFGPLIADISHWFNRRRGFAVAVTASGNYIAGALWPSVIQSFVESDGWRATYMGIGVICVVLMIPLALLLRQKAPQTGAAAGSDHDALMPALKPIHLSPRTLQWILIVAGFACCTAMSMPQVHIVAYCVDLGYGAGIGAEMLSLMLAGGVVSRIFSGFIADYIGGARTILLGSFLQCMALILYMPFNGPSSLYIVSLIFGLSQGGIVPSYAIIVREYLPAREAGQRIGAIIFATVLGMAFGGWMSGWIFDLTGSYQAAFLNGIAWNLLNLAMIVLVLWRTTRGRAAYA